MRISKRGFGPLYVGICIAVIASLIGIPIAGIYLGNMGFLVGVGWVLILTALLNLLDYNLKVDR